MDSQTDSKGDVESVLFDNMSDDRVSGKAKTEYGNAKDLSHSPILAAINAQNGTTDNQFASQRLSPTRLSQQNKADKV